MGEDASGGVTAYGLGGRTSHWDDALRAGGAKGLRTSIHFFEALGIKVISERRDEIVSRSGGTHFVLGKRPAASGGVQDMGEKRSNCIFVECRS